MTEESVTKYLLNHQLQIGAVVYGILRDYHTTEDVLQDVLVKAIARRDRFPNQNSLIAWARVCAKNAAIDICRQTKNRKNLLDGAALDALAADSNEYAAEALATRTDALKSCLKKLSQKTRDVMTLRYFHDHSIQEIATARHLKPGAVYQIISRTHRQLRDCVKHQLLPRHDE